MRSKSKAKIQSLTLNKAQRGILVAGLLSIPTRRQSTNETHELERSYSTHSTLKALWLFRRDAMRYADEQRKAPGGHDLEPSNFRPCLLWT